MGHCVYQNKIVLQLRGLGNKDLFRLISVYYTLYNSINGSFCWTKLGVLGPYCTRWRCVHNRPVDLNDTPTIQTPYKDINMRAIKRQNTLYCVKYLYIITSLDRYYKALSQSLGTRNTFAVNFTIKLNEQDTWQKYNKTSYFSWLTYTFTRAGMQLLVLL